MDLAGVVNLTLSQEDALWGQCMEMRFKIRAQAQSLAARSNGFYKAEDLMPSYRNLDNVDIRC